MYKLNLIERCVDDLPIAKEVHDTIYRVWKPSIGDKLLTAYAQRNR